MYKYGAFIGKRIVLTTSQGVVFAGNVVQSLEAKDRDGLLLELDKKTGISLFCPYNAIKEIMEVPLGQV